MSKKTKENEENTYSILEFDAEFGPDYKKIEEQLGIKIEDLPIYTDDRAGDFGKKLARELIENIKSELEKVL